LYTRHGCHLCEEAARLLQEARRRYGFGYEVVDVDGNPELTALYGGFVPVVTVDGKLRFKGGVNGAMLERLLRAEAGRRGR
jgi:glutaredoxin